MAERLIDLAIIGAGPAGLAAAIYAARAGVSAVTFEGMQASQLSAADVIENYPGFADGVPAAKLLEEMRGQASAQGAEFEMDEIESVDFSGSVKKLRGMAGGYEARSVVIATGARAKWLGIPGEERYKRHGVSVCATCDGAFFKGKNVAVIGGGDTALSEAIYLSRLAAKVAIVHRRESFRATEALQKRLASLENVELRMGETPVAFEGDGKVLSAIILSGGGRLEVSGAFVAIGHEPATGFLSGAVALDPEGYVKTDTRQTTDVPGVFAAGDCADPRYRQAIVAAGRGAAAAIEACFYLQNQGG